MSFFTSSAMKSAIASMCSVARTRIGFSMLKVAESSRNASVNFLVYCCTLTPAWAGVADDFVIHVGDVHYVLHFVSALAQKTIEKVDGYEGAEIADVAVVIDGWSAGVHADVVTVDRMEVLDLAGEGVIEAQWHRGAEQRCV